MMQEPKTKSQLTSLPILSRNLEFLLLGRPQKARGLVDQIPDHFLSQDEYLPKTAKK